MLWMILLGLLFMLTLAFVLGACKVAARYDREIDRIHKEIEEAREAIKPTKEE